TPCASPVIILLLIKLSFFYVIPRPPISTLFPYTTLFRSGLMKNMYPERDLPSITDKKYAEKLLNVSDDGEKHIMLGGLYKTHIRSEEHTSELQSRENLVCRLLLEKKKTQQERRKT